MGTFDLSVLEKISLEYGSHRRSEEGMCVMEAVAYVAGEPFGDHPKCASPVVASFMRSWNDSLPTNADRDRLLKPLIPLLLNSKGDDATEMRRSYMALDWLLRTYLPTWLDLSDRLKHDAAKLCALPELVDAGGLALASPLVFEAKKNAAAARAAAWYAAGDAAWYAAWYAAGAAAWYAAGAAAWYAAGDAAWYAAWYAAGDAARAAAGEKLAPTVEQLQASAVDLVKRMCAVGGAV